MNRNDEIMSYHQQINSKIDCLRKLNYEIYDLMDPRDYEDDLTDYMYDLVYSLDEAIEKFTDLIGACDAQMEIKKV